LEDGNWSQVNKSQQDGMYSAGSILIVVKYRSPIGNQVVRYSSKCVLLAVFSKLPSSHIPSSCAVIMKRKEWEILKRE